MRWVLCLALLVTGCKSARDSRQGASPERRQPDRRTTCSPTGHLAKKARARARGDRPLHPRSVCLRAIGLKPSLSRGLRRALDPTGFTPLPRPGPRDWLASHPETGQTFEEYVASRPVVPAEKQRRIELLPVGAFPAGASPPTSALKEYAAAFFGLETRLLEPARIADLGAKSRINPQTGRRQLYTLDILEALKKRRVSSSSGFCLQAITMEDLYPDPAWNFVFGQASINDRVGVYSFARYDPAFYGETRTGGYRRTLLRRSLNVMVHEIGHIFGLYHCVFYRCVLNGSNHLAEADARPMHLCPVCLHKLHHTVGFDLKARYRRLEAFYRRHGLNPDATFVAKRLTILGD